MTATRSGGWRVATGNAMLLALYLLPVWAHSAWQIWSAPIHGLFATANLGPAMFAANYMQLDPLNLVRFALLVALAKFTVVVFFIAFVVFSLSSLEHERAEGRDLLQVGLFLAAMVSFVSMVLAWRFGEAEALRLNATETLMILSAAIVAIVDVPRDDGASVVEFAEPVPAPASARLADRADRGNAA